MFWRPEGIYPAMLTPFRNNGSINEDTIADIVDFCIESGCTGLFALSSVGEFIHMDTDEACYLMDVVVNAAHGRVPVVAGVTASHIEKSIVLAKHAQSAGCHGIVCSPPYYYTVTQNMIARHYELLTDAVPEIPLILYNIPLFSTPLSFEVVEHVAKRPNVVAMKDSSGSLVDFMRYMESTRHAGINMMCGREEMIFSTTLLGAKGCMVGTATIFPEILVRIFDATCAGDLDTARDLQFAVCRAIWSMFSVPFPLGFKLAMEVRGFPMGPIKAALPDSIVNRMTEVRKELHSILSELCEYADISLIRGHG